MRLRRLACAATITALVASMATILVLDGGSPPPPVPVTQAPDQASAKLAAFRQGTRVEVLDQRTPTRAVFANPAGGMTAELTAVPTRVRRGDSWVPVDVTMQRRADGTVGPEAAVGELTLSGGGPAGALLTLRRDGHFLELTWPGPLPAPRLSAATATYPEVLPGVDLVLIAGPNGYQQQLVVKTAEAARNPALASIRLAVRTDGLTLKVDGAGSVHAAAAGGGDVFAAPPSTMWDAKGKTAKVAVSAADGALTLSPDWTALAGAGVAYPVTIDPNMVTFDKNAWATVLSGKSNQSYWWTSGSPPWAQVGQCYEDGWCEGIGEAQTYFQYDTGFLAGKTITQASLDTTVVFSPNCSGRTHRLHLADGQISPETTWNVRPGSRWYREFTAPGVYNPGGCGDFKTVGVDVADMIDTGGVTTFFLTAADSGDQIAWRKYDPGATKVVVTYNQVPDAPSDLATDPPLPAPCKWCGGARYLAGDDLRLIARLSDPDQDLVEPQWDIWRDGVLERRLGNGFQSSGAFHDTVVDLKGLRDGTGVDWVVRGSDGKASGPETHGTGAFYVDRVGFTDQQVPNVSAVLYQPDNRWHGGTGVPDTFTFTANNVGDVDHYLYGWQDPPATPVDAQSLGGPASVRLTPPGDGPRELFVQSVDRGGHRSKSQVHRFYVRPGNGPLAQWSFEGNAKDSAHLGDHHGTLAGAATYTSGGAAGSAVHLDGVAAQVSAPNAVRTDTSFSVATWLKLDQLPAAGTGFTAVSQDGGRLSGFLLGYRDEGGGKWEFTLPAADTAQRPAGESVRANVAASVGTWTHVAATYDSQAKQIRLYVNGVLAGTQARTSGFNATGPLAIGRGKWAGAPADFWPGSVDETQLYDRVLSAPEIAAQVGASGVQVAHWKFEERGGSTAVNAVEGAPDGVLDNGAAFVANGAVGGGIKLDGVDDSVSAAGPVVRTDQSFSVAVQVKLDRADAGTYTVLSQDGERICGFCLQYQGNRWQFIFPGSDADSPAEYFWVAGASPPKAGEWTALVGTYDASTRKIRLYVDGALAGESTRTTAWQALRSFRIGRAMIRAEQRQAFPGTLDEVRVYNRAIGEDEVRGIVSRDNVTAGTWRLDGTAVDANGKLPGVLNGGPDWSAGQTNSPDPADLAVQLNGTGAHISTPTAVHTDQSFSVAAWARADKTGAPATILSQDGTKVSGFALQATADRWAFTAMPSDGTAAGDQALGGTVQAGVWTHLAGVYSKDRKQLDLYVNGVLAGSAAHTTAFDATGGFQIGRGKRAGANADFFAGAVDDVSVYSRALFAGEVATMAGQDLSLGHNWTMDEGSGTTTGDAVGPRQATLRNGATFTAGRIGNAVKLDGVDDVVTTTGVDVRTDGSFTVSAWVNLEGTTCDFATETSCFTSAVSLDAGDGKPFSKFRLGYVEDTAGHDGNWTFEMPERDGTVTKAAVAAEPGELCRPGEQCKWVHLTGVYDVGARAIWVYVNGNRKDDGTLLTSWPGTGGLQIGGGKAIGEQPKSWRGGVDDVRIYSGALTADRVSALVRSYPLPGGPATLPVADAGAWKFDENTGTTVADSSGRAKTATLKGGAGWFAGRIDSTGWFDGTSGYAETAGPVVDTKGSFSVAGWAFLTDGARNATVLGQDANQVSAFQVRYDAATKKWAAVVALADQANAGSVVLVSSEQAQLNDWAHLALVYDVRLAQLRLYVNGALSAVQVGVTVQDATGKFAVGRARVNGTTADYFPRGVDDVRAYGRALTDGEVRRVHDEAPAAVHGFWRFDDGTARDYSWRQNPTTLSSAGTSFAPGVFGKALELDGVGGAARSTNVGVPMRDSFTVSAWAKLTRTDKVATVLAQDGVRRSGFALQYRPEVDRWMFGAATSDTDTAPLVYANSLQPPTVGAWTHLSGVYDYAARQLRLYVNGQLVGTKDNVLLWVAGGGLTIGRGRDKGATTEYFPGLIDEVTTDKGVRPADSIRLAGTFQPPSGGQLGRFVNDAGERYTARSATGSDAPFAGAPAGFRFDRPLGVALGGPGADTVPLYTCRGPAGPFTSAEPGCEGQPKIGTLGWAYATPPADVATVPLRRCLDGAARFDSTDVACEGRATDRVLGHVAAYTPLTRYFHDLSGQHYTSSLGAPPGFRYGRSLGLLATTDQPGTEPLLSCTDTAGQFVTQDPGCEGKGTGVPVGRVFTQPPPGLAGRPLYKCAVAGGIRFTSVVANCEGQTVLGQLGYALTTLPGPSAP
ncbi:LamG domain-containing protein [Amycolatopsis sp. NBC_00348]|uniref:LamG domain-containing protein n=1 Tax=Amycolatopsis sp. NBC_00348 TaxID=2975956 RepID=UPI002E254D61